MRAALPLLVLAAGSVFAQEKSWTGESVQYTKPAKDIQFGDVIDGKQVDFKFSGRLPILVRDDRDGRLRIHDHFREGWVDKADFVLANEAPAYFNRRIQADPKDAFALWSRGCSLAEKGDLENAIKDFDALISLSPNTSSPYNSRGLAWGYKKEYGKAINDYNKAIRLDPTNGLYFNNRGLAWTDKKDYDQAITDFSKAIQLDPKMPMAYSNRGDAWLAKKDYGKATADYNEAIRLDPKHVDAFNGLAWLLATCPDAKCRDGKKAVEFAMNASELTNWKIPVFAGTLAAAYAEAGDFEKAIKYQTQALDAPEYDRAYGEGARRRLELYRKKQPYRQE